MGCEWPCLNGCCERMEKIRYLAVTWAHLVKAQNREGASKALLDLIRVAKEAANATARTGREAAEGAPEGAGQLVAPERVDVPDADN